MAKTRRKARRWTDRRMERFLLNLLNRFIEVKRGGDGSVATFEEAMLLTRDRGVVVDLGKDQFQITIVDSSRR